MHRLFMVVALLGALALFPNVTRAESVSVSPAVGSQYEVFVFSGTNFTPGAQLVVVFATPDGQRVDWYQHGTADLFVITANEAGEWTFSVLPVEELAGLPTGEWAAAFCVVGGSESCFTGTFTILG